jgi:hypothetical protein
MAFAVTYAVRRRGRIAGVLLLVAAVAACQAKNPGAPTEFASATINGTVLAPVPTGLRVSVGASSNSTPVDSAGRFALTNVLPGNVELRFTNGGATAVLPLSGVLANQTITITVTYGGSSVALESSRRVVGTDEELEGRVESVTAPDSLFIAGRAVVTSGSTVFLANGQTVGFSALTIGQRVAVRGQSTAAALVAGRLEIFAVISASNVNGAITVFTGTRSAFQFSVGGTEVQGDAGTMFASGSQFNELANGILVKIAGVQRSGFVYASSIEITSPAIDFNGRIISMTGSAPEIMMVVTSRTVQVSARTEVRRKGDLQKTSTLANGQTVDVKGRVITDGTIVSSGVNILTDAAGGTFAMEGTVSALSGSCPNLMLTASSYEITTDSSTTFESPCSGFAVGDRVEVVGVVQFNLTVRATALRKQ